MATNTPTGTIDMKALAEELMRKGMVEPGQGGGGQNNGQRNALQQMMIMSAAKNMSPSHLAGGLLGNVLRKLIEGGISDWKDRYEARGDLKHLIQTKGRDWAQKWIQGINEKDPSRGAYLQEHLDKWAPPAPQSTQEAAQPLLLGTENQEAVNQAFANAQMPQNIQGLLGQISQRNGYSPQNGAEVNAPFENPSLSLDFWQQLKNTGLVR